MKIARFGMAAFGFLAMLVFGSAAQAQVLEDVTPIVGQWADKFPDGTAMITVISPSSVTFYLINHEGVSNGPPTTIDVTFKKYDVGTYLATPTGPVGEPMAFKESSRDTIFIQFEGKEPRTLTRQRDMGMNNPHGN
jgi:hypothetical protein